MDKDHKHKISKTLKERGIRPPSRQGSKWSKKQHIVMRERMMGDNNPAKKKDTKIKISKKLKGRKLSKEWTEKIAKSNRGKKGFWAGKKRVVTSKEIREKISVALRGKKGSGWRGGITPENKRIRRSLCFRLWREAVFLRDNFTCKKCNKEAGYLHPHHIKNFSEYPELRFAMDNGLTFCKNCHEKFHKKYGRKNNTLEQLIEFLSI
jgi:hypothetical protein